MNETLLNDVLMSTLNTIVTEVNCVNNYILELRDLLSATDKQSSVTYHEIEKSNFNASHGYMLAKKLQALLRERRRIKNSIRQTQVIQQGLNRIRQQATHCENKIKGA